MTSSLLGINIKVLSNRNDEQAKMMIIRFVYFENVYIEMEKVCTSVLKVGGGGSALIGACTF